MQAQNNFCLTCSITCGIMETDMVFIQSCSWRYLALRLIHDPVSNARSGAFLGSNASSGGIILVDSWTYLRGDIIDVFFLFLLRLCGQNFDLDRIEGAGGLTTAGSLLCARSFVIPVSARLVAGREGAERGISKKRKRRSGQSSVVFFRCNESQCTCGK